MKHDIDGKGERSILCSVYTLTVYEQEFKRSMVADVYGVVELKRGGTETVTAEFVASRMQAAMAGGKSLPKATVALINKAFPASVITRIDYTADNWEAYIRAYWAMLRTGDALSEGMQSTPAFSTWVASLGDVNLREVSNIVFSCMEDGVFHSRA